MKRFILRFLVFALLVVGVFGSICVLEIGWEIRHYRETEVLAPTNATILVFNDSQTDMGIDSDDYPEFFNFSAHGRTLDQSELVLIDLLASNPGKFKTVLIDVSPSSAVDDFNLPIENMGYASQYYILHFLHREENIRDLTHALVVMRDNMVGKRWRHFWRSLRGRQTFRSSFGGVYTPKPETLSIVARPAFEGNIRGRSIVYNQCPELTDDAPVFGILDRIVRQVVRTGARPVLMTTPWHAQLLAACDAQRLAVFSDRMRAYADRKGIRYLDYLSLKLPEDHWYDGQHLNVRGAKAFTALVKKDLER